MKEMDEPRFISSQDTHGLIASTESVINIHKSRGMVTKISMQVNAMTREKRLLAASSK